MIRKLSILLALTTAPILTAQNVNFSEDVASIIYGKCTSCHRPNEIAPFPLTNYAEVANRSMSIKYVVENDLMPPWPPDPNYTHLVGERILTVAEKQTIIDWVNNGAPQGDPSQEPALPNFPSGSVLGVPDMVLSMSESYTTNGNNQDDYRVFVLPTGLTQDREIAAMEFRPGNKKVVHHALFASDINGQAQQRDANEPGYGYTSFGEFGVPTEHFYGGWAPGLLPDRFPSGTGQILPAGSDLLMQLHYAPYPFAEQDSSYVNIFFTDQPIVREVENYEYAYFNLFLPANQVTTVKRAINISTDVSLIGFLPHAHLIGESWELYFVKPSGDTTKVIRIPDWDFNWQGMYKPLYMTKVPAGSTFYMECTYDNTASNPNNPNTPPADMGWGDNTSDEMFYCVLQYVDYLPGDEQISLQNSLRQEAFDGPGSGILEVFPNPVGSDLNAEVFLQSPSTVRWKIHDALGREVMASDRIQFHLRGTHRWVIAVSELPEGAYVLHLELDSGILSRNFLKE